MDIPDKCFIIAELGVNHNGEISLARTLVKAAAEAGADAVKFQSFSAEKLVVAGTPTAAYQQTNSGDTDQAAMLRRLELSEAMHQELAEYARRMGVEFMSTPFDESAADMLVGLGVHRLKIPSGELTNHPLIAHVARKGLNLILSTGMATLAEVGDALAVIERTRLECGFSGSLADSLTLLHCTSNYPTALEDVNLRAMQTMGAEFGVPVGYSDHTEGILVAVAAAALGARIVEKHFTTNRNLPGPDHQASLEPLEFAEMVRQIRAVGRALGDGLKAPRDSEMPVRALVRRSVVAACDIPTGRIITADDLTLRRPGHGLPPADFARVVGRRALMELPCGTLIELSHLE